ncbi:MAG: hypothetical protein H0T76_16500 [Nannocystis sp.]|nr:vitamin K epoxide reductase family protein [Nannocystis sp.]MBA3548083.1 hypothetical protein [Nannocystis sp.]
MSAISDSPVRADLVGSVSVWAFSVPGLVLSALLTVLRLRSDHRCDDTFLGACSGDGLLSCSTVLGDAWATVFGLPLTVYASAYFLVTLGLAGATLLSPHTLRPLVRPVLLLASWAGLAVAVALAIYAVFGLGALCLYCLFLDGVCLGVFLAAMLGNRGRVLPVWPPRAQLGATWMVAGVAGLGFLTAVTVQRALVLQFRNDAAEAEALRPCVVALRELEVPALRLPSPAGPPTHIAALFLDLACPHCKAEYAFWRAYQVELAERGVAVELQLFHFPRECSPEAGVSDVSRARACDAARAQLCLGRGDSERGLGVFERMFAEQAEPFTSEHLAQLAGSFAVEADAGSADSPLFACMRGPEVAAELHRHLTFGEAVAGLRAAPGALLVPLRDGRPTGVAKQVQGRKPREFYERYFGARGDDVQP